MGYRNCATVRARGLVLGCKQLFHPKQPKQPIFNRNPNRGSVRWDPTSYSPCIQSSSAVPHASSSSNSTNTHSPFDSSLQNRQRPRTTPSVAPQQDSTPTLCFAPTPTVASKDTSLNPPISSSFSPSLADYTRTIDLTTRTTLFPIIAISRDTLS